MTDLEILGFKEAIKKTITYYKEGDIKMDMENHPVCALTKIAETTNCYRCPLNVTAKKDTQDYGCLVRKNHDIVKLKEASPLERAHLTAFYEKVLTLIDIFPPKTQTFTYKTKSMWAAALRTLDIVFRK